MLLKLTLENYVPLLSSNIHKVELDTDELVNLFISANGSGKTSILKEVHPFPPENANYKDGRKKTEWIINGKLYVLDSYTHTGTGHSFKVYEQGDEVGKELNTGGTYTVQKELVENHLKASLNILKFLGGIRITDRFSAMSPARRKEILMELYPNDTEYAMSRYNKLKTERNELRAAIKNQAQRFAEENRKLTAINECGIEQLEQRIKMIDVDLKQSLLVRGQLEGITVDPELQEKVQRFTWLTDQLTVNKVSGIFLTEPEIRAAIATAEDLIGYYQDKAGILAGIISDNAGFLDGMEEFLKDPELLETQAKTVKEEELRIVNQLAEWDLTLERYPVFENPEADLTGLRGIADHFMSYLHRVTVASDAGLTGAAYKGYLTAYEQNTVQLRNLTLTSQGLKHDLEHIQNMDLIECPDCTHQFKRGVQPGDAEKIQKSYEGVLNQIEKLEKEQGRLKLLIDNDAEWYSSMNQLFTMVRENNHVRILPELIKEFEVGKVTNARLCNALQAYCEREKLNDQLGLLEGEKRVLHARLNVLNKNKVLDIANHVAHTEKELITQNSLIRVHKQRLESLQRQLKTITSYNDDLLRLAQLREEIVQGLGNESKVTLRQSVDTRIHELSVDKEHILTSIIKNKSLSAVVDSISSDIERLKRRLKIVEVWMNGLCPNKGLLGKLMMDFIKTVCGNANVIIKEIWNTPLYVKHCGKENGDLTYKFPVVTGDYSPSPDISDCSGGEIDILDWVWRFVLAPYHPFPFPLIMDEVGPYLDEIKRTRFFNFIREYTQRTDARQLFLVSHYVSQYSVFDKPNIVALRYEGLTLTGEVNQNTVVI